MSSWVQSAGDIALTGNLKLRRNGVTGGREMEGENRKEGRRRGKEERERDIPKARRDSRVYSYVT